MDGLAKAILGFLLLIAAIYLVCIVVAFLILVALVAAPPVLSGYWLRNRTRKFALSRRKVCECVFLGLALFCLPLLTVFADASAWPMALWTSCLLGLAGPATYLTIEGYRQVFWPHRKVALAEGANARRLGWTLWTRRLRLSRMEKAIRREDERHGGLRHELGQVRSLAREIVLRTDPAFFSAEVARWSRACAAMSTEDLQRRAAALPDEAVVKTLERALRRLPELVDNRPHEIRAVLQAATIQAEVITRMVRTPDDAYEENVQEAQRLRSETDALQAKFAAAQDNRMKAVETIRRLRRERVTVQ
jgi:hypothetical protein